MAQYFWGHPETFRAAAIKSERELGTAANIGAGVGGLWGIARGRQQESDQLDAETAKFEAMLNRAQKQAELEATNDPKDRALQMEPGDGGTTHGEPTDVISNQDVHPAPVPSTQGEEGNPLSAYGRSVMERGKIIGSQAVTGLGRFAKGVGAFLGVSPDESMQAKRMNLARLAGVAEKQKMNAAMDRAVAGTLPKYQDPAKALQFFRGDSEDPKALEVAPSASKVNEWTLREDAAMGDPIAKKILEQRQNERIAQRQAGRSNINIHNTKLPQIAYQAGDAQARMDAAQMIREAHGVDIDPTEVPFGIVKDVKDWLTKTEKPYTMQERMDLGAGATTGKRYAPRPPIEDPNYLRQYGLDFTTIEGGEVDMGQDDPAIAPYLKTLPPDALGGGLPPKNGKPGKPARPESNQKVIDQDTNVPFTE